MPLIEFAEVTHAFGDGQPVLKDITVELTERRIGVIGANGSGKSTFVRMINGLVIPEAGTVRVDGDSTANQARRIRRKVGFCFTNPDSQIVMPTVAEDVAFGLRRLRLSKTEVQQRVTDVLATYGLTELADRPAHTLSGGQKQLLALASVVVTEPEVLILDEPTTLLDLSNERRIRHEIERLDLQVILVTHHLHLLDGFDRTLVFDNGRLVCDDEPDQARAAYRSLAS
ncbi:ABC transporter ATP-binding protein [Kribbella albertanoniae]|uniref:ABC transporter ATP-binding protein n=1 Tax=Kribbella albertanoniae TaxID=1266829 RepID=A0A4R4PW22_9ACTN|nr:ABC transporter ATP-binding protein [Kribbella albertanoniae]TDC26634.1 ABC transporter ATP-binding protein [Kribbella albertanoniae]